MFERIKRWFSESDGADEAFIAGVCVGFFIGGGVVVLGIYFT